MAKLNDIWTHELAVHFNSIKYEIKEISFIAIEKNCHPWRRWSYGMLLTKEVHKIAQLFIQNSNGLNWEARVQI